MRLRRFGGLRRRLSYANVMATLAFFFALTGGAAAATKYLLATDPIPATSDLAGSTYGNPMIAGGKVTSGKIADGAITSTKFDSAATAPNAAKVGGLDVVTVTDTRFYSPQSGFPVTLNCPGDRLAVDTALSGVPDLSLATTDYTHSSVEAFVINASLLYHSGTLTVSCFGA